MFLCKVRELCTLLATARNYTIFERWILDFMVPQEWLPGVSI